MPASAEERLVLRALAALIAFVFAAGTAVALVRSEEEPAAPDATTVDGEPLYSGTGPLPGADVPAWVVRRTAALRRVRGRASAVVSFRSYRVAREARAAAADVDAIALLVAAPGGEPAVVTGGLDRWAVRERAAAEVELANLVTMLETTEDPDFRAEFQADVDRLRGMVERLDAEGAVVFGAVVVADVAALRALAERADVRLVDVVAEGEVEDRDALVGLRPEETTRAGTPRTRPLPST